MRTFGRCMASAVALMICLLCVHPAFGASTQGSVTGVVIDASTGANIAGAKLTLTGSGKSFSSTSDAHGAFAFSNIDPGTWVLRTTAVQYQLNVSGELKVIAGQETDLVVALQSVTTANITTLGHVTVRGSRALNTTSAAVVTISGNDYVNTGTTQIQQLLETTPGVTVEHNDNGAPGNVATLSIRGAGGFAAGINGSNTGYEVLVLQDGEPIRNGGFGDADLSALTPAIYARTEVVKGVGGTSLFGANTIGGTLNLVTIDPRSTEGAEAMFTVGSYGTTDFNLAQTNTYGRFGYVFDLHQYGTDGFIPTQFLVDSPPFTFSSSATTPPIGAILHPTLAMNLRSGLGKIRYNFSNSSYGVVTVTDESDWRDQFGLLSNPETVFLSSVGPFGTAFSNDPLGHPYFFGFPMNYVWNTSPKYAVDLHTTVGGGALAVRYYDHWLNRWVDGNNASAPGCCFLQEALDHLTGALATWDKPFGNHDITLAVGGNSDNFRFGSLGSGTPVKASDIVPTTGSELLKTFLARDEYAISPKFRATFAGYYSNYNQLNVKRFDPRLAIINRPTDDSVVRFSVGSGFAAPRLSDIVSPLNLSISQSVAGPNCTSSNPFCNATQGNPAIKEETGFGYDLGYERTWGRLGDFSVDLYRTSLQNHIFTAIFPPPPPPNNVFSDGVTPVLGVEKPVNIAASVYTGIEFSGSLPVARDYAIKGYYNTQAAYPINVDIVSEQAMGNIVNSQQYLGVPLHKVGYSVNYQNVSRVNAFIGGDWYGPNNSYNVPQFWIYNAGITTPLVGDTILHLAWKNMFNKNATIFSTFNGGVPYPTVAGFNGCPTFNPCTFSTNAYSFAPHSFSVTLDTRWGSLK